MTEDVKVIDIDLTDVQKEAQDASKTLKDLRNEVKQLRQTLENTEISSEEFGKTLSDLTKKQQELTNVTKSGISAQKGSYNELVNQMAILKTEWRSTADESRRAALGEQISSINTQLKELDSSIGNHQREVGNYKLALKNLKEELLNLEEGTEEYNKKLSEAAEISQKMQDVNEFVAASAADLGDHMQNLVGTASGIVGAFQTVQATLNLVGIESEEVTKMIATMQNVMAITQGLSAIEGSIDAFKRLSMAVKAATVASKGLKIALVGLGIGAVVVAAGFLYEWWVKLNDKTEELVDNMKTLERHTAWLRHKETINGAEEFCRAIEQAGNDTAKLKKLLEEKEKSDQSTFLKRLKEDAEMALQAANDAYRAYNKLRAEKGDDDKETQEAFTKYEELQKKKLETEQKYNSELVNSAKDKAQDIIDAEERQIEAAKKAAEEKKRLAEKIEKEELERRKKAAEQRREELEKEREAAEALQSANEEFNAKLDADIKAALRESQQYAIDESVRAQEEKIRKKFEETFKISGLIEEVQGSIDTLMSLDLGHNLSEEFNIAFDAAQKGLFQMRRQLKDGEKDWMKYGRMAATGLNAASDILSSIASKQNAETKEGFEKQKKLQIAAATMAMFGGVVNAVTSAFNPANAWMTIWGQAAAASAMSAMVLATGGMQIAQIKKQKFDGDGGNSDSIGVPALSALQMIDTGVQATTNVDGASVEGNVNDTRVYVVESDITSSQSNVKTTISEATF